MARATAPTNVVLDRPVAERVLESVRRDIRAAVESGNYAENPDRFARLADGAAHLSAALRKTRKR